MQRWSCLALLAILVVVALYLCPVAQALTQAQRDAVLDAHNAFRSAKGLVNLTYNLDAETFAQNYVDSSSGCPSGHSSGSGYGENLYWSSGSLTSLVPAVNNWHAEEPNWSCQNNDCKDKEMCGHYTQVMWNLTTSVGCGIKTTCSGGYSTMISCNYSPPGNYGGSRPFPLTTCPGYPYFSNDKFVLTITLNTTAAAYSAASFKTALNSALSLGDANRIVILKSEQVSSGRQEVDVYIVSVGSSSGSDKATSLVSRVQSRDKTLNNAGLYATEAAYSSSSPGSALNSWVDLLAQ